MTVEAKLSRLLGTLADQRELIKNMDETSVNDLARDLQTLIKTSENGINHRDHSEISIAQVINEIIKSSHLASNFVGEFMVLYINDYDGFRRSKTRCICNFINHPNITKSDFFNGFLFFFNQGLFLYSKAESEEYQILPRPQWQEDITSLMELSFPRLKHVFFDICKFDDLILHSIAFFTTHSPSSLENGQFKQAVFMLLDKLSPERICKIVVNPRQDQKLFKFPEQHLNLF